MRDEEHKIQHTCVQWFRIQYPQLQGRLFAVPNGGNRDAVTGSRLKAEGVVAGVCDLILLVKRGRYGAMLIEMKKPGGYLSRSQKDWYNAVCADGDYCYVVCKSVEDFAFAVKKYLGDENGI